MTKKSVAMVLSSDKIDNLITSIKSSVERITCFCQNIFFLSKKTDAKLTEVLPTSKNDTYHSEQTANDG